MAFAQIVPKIGRPAHARRVTATHNGNKVIAVMLSVDLADHLRLSDAKRVRIELGTGKDFGRLRISRASVGEEACVATYRRGRRVGFNIRQAFLPDASVPERSVTLPHDIRGETIILDLAPLRIDQVSLSLQRNGADHVG